MARFDAPVPDRQIERERHRSGRRIAVAIHGDDELRQIDAQLPRGRLEYAHVGLVRNEPVDVRGSETAHRQSLARDFVQHLDRELENRLPVHVQERRPHDLAAADVAGHGKNVHVRAVSMQRACHDTGLESARSITAPAPSPNSTAVPRSFQSRIREYTSAPTMRAQRCWPDRIKLSAIASAYTKPLQTA